VDRIDRFFDKIPGGYFAIASGLLGPAVLLLATLLHTATEPLSPLSHFVSSLGVGPNGARQVFTVGVPAAGIIALPYFIYLSRSLWAKDGEDHAELKKAIALAGFLLLVSSLVGLIIAALFDVEEESLPIHRVGAAIFFGCFLGAVVAYTLVMALSSTLSRTQLGMGIIVIVLYLLMMVSAAWADTSPASSPATSPEDKAARLLQWATVISVNAWLIVMGLHRLRPTRELGSTE
jgi:hypothetical protein